VKKLLFFLIVFAFSFVALGQQKDTTKVKTKKLSYLNVGADPQDLLRTLRPGEILAKYIGKKPIAAVTNSKSGKRYEGLLRSGFGAFVKEEDYKNDKIKNFVIFNCGNDSELRGSKAKILGIPKDSLLAICSYEQIHSVQKSEDLKKLSEYIEKIFGPQGEFENLSNQMYLVTEKIKEVDERTIRMEQLFIKNSALKDVGTGNKQDDAINTSPSVFGWMVDAVAWAVGIGGTSFGIYKICEAIFDKKDSNPQNITNPSGPPGPPLTKISLSVGFGR
jgi:hypothetical protein